MPFERFQQVGSFVEPAAPPIDPWDGGDLVALPCVNVEWLRLLLGAGMQLLNPSSWLESLSDSGRVLVLQRATDFLAGLAALDTCVNPIVDVTFADCSFTLHFADGSSRAIVDWDGTIKACVQGWVPPSPPVTAPGATTPQKACSIATWLQQILFQDALQKLSDALHAGQSVDQWITGVIDEITAFAPILGFITGPFLALHTTALPQPLADLDAALADATFQQNVICAIYNAIVSTGYVDATNFPNVGSNLAAISYTHAWVPTMIANFWANMGLPAWEQIQAENPLGPSTGCTTCGGWCWYMDFGAGPSGWVAESGAGLYLPSGYLGPGWYQQTASGPRLAWQASLTIPGAVPVTGVDIWVIDPQTKWDGSGYRAAYNQNPCGVTNLSTVDFPGASGAFPSLTKISLTGLTGSPTCVRVYWDSVNGANAGCIKGIALHGNGPNPFGPDNCPP